MAKFYRPSLSQRELEELLSYIPNSSPLHSKLTQYLLKVRVGLNSPAYLATTRTLKNLDLGLAASTLSVETVAEQDRLEQLMQKATIEVLTAEEKQEGSKLELKYFGMEMGSFS